MCFNVRRKVSKVLQTAVQDRSLSGTWPRLFQARGADELKPRCDKTVLVGLVSKSSCDDERSERVGV